MKILARWCPYPPTGPAKLAGEALISSYCFMFDLTGCAFRFGNVVGARQTHGLALISCGGLMRNPERLQILGDGTQSKSYIHIF